MNSIKNKIVWQINYTDSPYAKDAGGLNLNEVNEDRRKSRKNNFDYDTYEKVKHVKTGVSWRHLNDDNSSFDSYFFYQKRDFNSKLPSRLVHACLRMCRLKPSCSI